MKTTTDKIYAYLLQKYEMDPKLVDAHLRTRGFSPATVDNAWWGVFIAEGANKCGIRLEYRDCYGDSDLGSGWGG